MIPHVKILFYLLLMRTPASQTDTQTGREKAMDNVWERKSFRFCLLCKSISGILHTLIRRFDYEESLKIITEQIDTRRGCSFFMKMPLRIFHFHFHLMHEIYQIFNRILELVRDDVKSFEPKKNFR